MQSWRITPRPRPDSISIYDRSSDRIVDLRMDNGARDGEAADLPHVGKKRSTDAHSPRALREMPVFSSKGAPRFDPEHWRLSVGGLVSRPLSLSYDEILKLPRGCLTADFSCVEGWRVENVEWVGVPVRTVINMAEPTPSARYVLFKAGRFTATLALNDALKDETILAYLHKNQLLTFEHGRPLRLIFPSQECFQSLKWVNGIELTENYVEVTARHIALARLNDKSPISAAPRNRTAQIEKSGPQELKGLSL